MRNERSEWSCYLRRVRLVSAPNELNKKNTQNVQIIVDDMHEPCTLVYRSEGQA